MAIYIDSGSGEADQDSGHWFDANVVAGINEFRCQSGYFSYAAIKPFAQVIHDLATAGGQVHFVLGSNSGSLIAADAQRALRVAAGVNASLTIVSFADAEFHPKTVHVVRSDGSITAVVGSSNLTGRGLGRNVEAGIILDSRAGDPPDELERMRTAIDWWRNVPKNAAEHPQVAPAVFPIVNDDDIRDLVERGIINIPQPRRSRPGGAGGAAGGGNQLPRRQPTWLPNHEGWEPEIPDLIPVPSNSEDGEGNEISTGPTVPTSVGPAAPESSGGSQSTGSQAQEVLLMRVRPRRVYEKLPDGTPLGTQIQISMTVHNSPFFNGTEEIVSAADGSHRKIGYDYVKRSGVKVQNTARFEAPEMEGMTKPVARFRWIDGANSMDKTNRILQFELFDADHSDEGLRIFENLEAGIDSPPEINLEQLSREETVLSTSDRNSAQWYRLDSI